MEIREVVKFHQSGVTFVTLQELHVNHTRALMRDSNKICEKSGIIRNNQK